MLETPEPYRIEDVQRDPRLRGWWPSGHPDMRSFLGVPIVARGGIVGAFYRDREPDKTLVFVAEMGFDAPEGAVVFTCPCIRRW